MDVDAPFPSFECDFDSPTSESLRLCPLWVGWGAQTWHLRDGYVDALRHTIDLWHTDIEYAHICNGKLNDESYHVYTANKQKGYEIDTITSYLVVSAETG